ncbi:hypothetical protein RF11_07779 [Thelohanellus kitauei]|uniref:Uncharacterized protein n=1 Tax=Thelohanellus kitauei TaxID=669202 RepID=A0A0C2N2X5_THEKT|nr:hypothetical protein RF11_07779 [Thelohanellus kitauei]
MSSVKIDTIIDLSWNQIAANFYKNKFLTFIPNRDYLRSAEPDTISAGKTEKVYNFIGSSINDRINYCICAGPVEGIHFHIGLVEGSAIESGHKFPHVSVTEFNELIHSFSENSVSYESEPSNEKSKSFSSLRAAEIDQCRLRVHGYCLGTLPNLCKCGRPVIAKLKIE